MGLETALEETVSSLKFQVSSRENGRQVCNSNSIGFRIWFNLVQFGSIWFNLVQLVQGPWWQARRATERVDSFGRVFLVEELCSSNGATGRAGARSGLSDAEDGRVGCRTIVLMSAI